VTAIPTRGIPTRLAGGPDSAVAAKIPLLAGVILCVFAIFVARLFQLQIVESAALREKSQVNSVRTTLLAAPRGKILDREGRVLASTRPAFEVALLASELRRKPQVFAALGQLIEVDPARFATDVAALRGRARFQPLRVASDLSLDQRARVEAHLYALPGVVSDIRPRRAYPYGTAASHLLGYLGEIRKQQLDSGDYEGYRQGEVIGQSGVEALVESQLRGKAGGRNQVVDVAGRVREVLGEAPPIAGGDVVLTIDLDLQLAAEAAFAPDTPGGREKMGSIVALDARTGDVLAMISKPSFDPNHFAGGVAAEEWKRLTRDEWKPLQNRALAGQYPPGSTYKAFVAAAALEKGLVRPEERIYCPGAYRLGRRSYRCWKKEGHGEVDLHTALARSCDVYFYTVGRRLGIDQIAFFSRGFGLGALTKIPLRGEQPGLIPTAAWKERRFREKWMEGETVSASIGQGFNLVTPLQLAVSYAAIGNGGFVMAPRLVLRAPDENGEMVEGPPPQRLGTVPVAARHLARVASGLEAVVGGPGGTGGRARVPGIRVAGKTGTAQVVSLQHTDGIDEQDLDIRYRDHAWFGSFAPAENAEIAVAVLVEHGGHGGSAAAPLAQKVLAKYFEKKALRENPPPPATQVEATPVVAASGAAVATAPSESVPAEAALSPEDVDGD
jgi:penicillin-binding protein 2